ncbi:MAG TPA: tetratricopeptide repeat protein, partial [Candidatus Ozemobacteraceae bacterium]|nr:tetratricopeptide repeat protein [Candidatus Ozemobacteraceae bacterium]
MSRRLWSILLIMGGFSILSAQSDVLLQSVSAAGGRNAREAYLEQFQAGESAMAARRYDAAIRSYQAALAIQGEQVRPRFRLAQALVESGRAAESLPHFERLLAQAPQNIPARILLSRALIDTGRGAEAARHLEWILQVQPGHAEAASLLAACGTAGKPAAAMAPARAAAGGATAPRVAVAGGVDADAAFPTVTVAAGAGQRAPAAGFQPLSQNEPQGGKQQRPKSGATTREFIPAGFEPLPVQKAAAVPEEEAPVPAKSVSAGEIRRPPAMELPPDASNVDGWRVSDFMQAASGSLPVVLGYATYCIEKDDLKKADEYLDRAEGLAIELRQTKRFLEVQIHKSLVTLYKADIDGFGRQLIKVKPLLSKQTYLSFLDIYNKTRTATGPVDVAR